MSKQKKSGSAIFMDCVIALTFVASIVCFVLYYANIVRSLVVLWAGITVFTILYHFGLRIFFGEVTKRFNIRYTGWWFKERRYEKKLYDFLRVKKWKDKVLTYDPAAFSMENHTLEEIANTMSKAETDHWINEIISITTIFFSLIWGELWIFLTTAILAMLFDAQFIIIQRYNRPRVVKAIERQNSKKTA